MIPSLFAFQFKWRLRRLVPAMAFSLLLGALAVCLYTPERLEGLRYLRGELPEVFTFLGYEGDTGLGIHLMGLLCGFILPLLVIFLSVSGGSALVATPVADGRMAMLLAAGHRRSAILMTLYVHLFLEAALVLMACLAGQAVMAAALFPGFDFFALLRLCLGLILISSVYCAFAVFMAARAPTPGKMRGFSRLAMALTLLFTMAARLPGWARALRFFSPLTLFQGTALVSGSGGWPPALSALPIAGVFLFMALWRFSSREM